MQLIGMGLNTAEEHLEFPLKMLKSHIKIFQHSLHSYWLGKMHKNYADADPKDWDANLYMINIIS